MKNLKRQQQYFQTVQAFCLLFLRSVPSSLHGPFCSSRRRDADTLIKSPPAAVSRSSLSFQLFQHLCKEFRAEHLSLSYLAAAAAAAKSLQSCPTLCDPIDGSPPGSSIHGIFQARVLEWGAIAFSRATWQAFFHTDPAWLTDTNSERKKTRRSLFHDVALTDFCLPNEILKQVKVR